MLHGSLGCGQPSSDTDSVALFGSLFFRVSVPRVRKASVSACLLRHSDIFVAALAVATFSCCGGYCQSYDCAHVRLLLLLSLVLVLVAAVEVAVAVVRLSSGVVLSLHGLVLVATCGADADYFIGLARGERGFAIFGTAREAEIRQRHWRHESSLL